MRHLNTSGRLRPYPGIAKGNGFMYNVGATKEGGTARMDNQDMERDLIEIYDDEDNPILTEVLDYFFYNGEEYVLLAVVNEEEEEEETDEPLEVDCFVMKVREFTDENGEEMEEFIPVDDDDLEGKLLEVATQYLDELNNPETEEE
jgi:hypothetical protein